MKIHNSLSAKKEEFTPKEPGIVNMYVCGPTVYNFLHVGNMRTAVVFDAVRRYLEYKGYRVNMVQNFTDVDDKIIARSLEEGISTQEVADKYINEVKQDFDKLNICAADSYPRVTEEMPEIIAMIEELIEKGCAYESAGHVFFAANTSKDYGKLSKKNIDDLITGARVQVNEDKKSPADFVLWKPAKEGEPFWKSPWSDGRPGWHIECSAIVRKYLSYVDIHGGGEDLIFPHHENEIAQSEALQSEPFAKYWMHVGMLTKDHKKMSKSLGNFFTLREVVEKFPPEVIRFFFLAGHYRMPMEYSEDLLESTGKALERIKNCKDMLKKAPSSEISQIIENFRKDFETKMDDDFNTADAISVIFELVKFANKNPNGSLLGLLDELLAILGIVFSEDSKEINSEVENLIARRDEARKNKDWATADNIRDQLIAMGVKIADGR